MEFSMDELLGHLGQPGRYQLLVCLLLGFNYFQIAYNHLCMVFFGAQPLAYRCERIEEIPSTNIVYHENSTSNGTCPLFKKDDWCKIRDNCTSCGYSTPYVTEDREWTVVAEFHLVCDDEYLSNLAASIYFMGMMVGAVFLGFLADAVGRLPVLLATIYLPFAIGVGLFFTKSYVVFVILRFCMGILMPGLEFIDVSLIMEYFSPKHRGVAVCVLEVFWGLGVLVFALIAFLIRDWHWIQLCYSLLILLSLCYAWLFPESLRWLLTKRKYDRAEKLIRRIAKYNGLKEIPNQVTTLVKQHRENATEPIVYNFLHLFRSKIIFRKSLILWYLWFAVAVGYYGLLLSTGVLYGFIYTNFLIGSAIEFIAYPLAIVVLYYFGRRWPLSVYFLIGGVACIVSGVLQDGIARTALALVGRFGISGAFAIMFIFSSELYPTLMRNVGLGSCSFCTRLGALLAPQINLLGTYTYKPLPIISFGVLSVVATVFVLVLPETGNTQLPDTLEEAEGIGWGWCRKHDEYDMSATDMTDAKSRDNNSEKGLKKYVVYASQPDI